MDASTLRRVLSRALLMAAAAGASGCCTVTEQRLTEREGESPVGPWGARTCEDVCRNRPDCGGIGRVVSCAFTGAVGARTMDCVYETSDCPRYPGPQAVCGRRHQVAEVARPGSWGDTPGALFAALAALEAEAVPAFERLARELRHHGAPDALTHACLDAADDERRHAAVMTRLAAQHGVTVTEAPLPEGALRPLAALADDNAREGCVGETFGALVAMWQAARAPTAAAREALLAVADDELRHAALSWRIDAWAAEALGARDELTRAKREAVARLVAAGGGVPERVARETGAPTRTEMRRLVAAAVDTVWRAEAAPC